MKRLLKITGSGPLAKDHRVYLNDVDISHCVSGVTVMIGVTHVDRAIIEYVGAIELPDEIKVLLEANPANDD